MHVPGGGVVIAAALAVLAAINVAFLAFATIRAIRREPTIHEIDERWRGRLVKAERARVAGAARYARESHAARRAVRR